MAGFAVGSFVHCWAWRSVNGESVLKGRSHCTSCAHVLAVKDLIPVVSWIALKGKCRYCGEPIPVRSLVVELLCGAVFAGIVLVYGISWQSLELMAFSAALVFLSLTDLDSFKIPNATILFMVAVRIAYMAYAFFAGLMTVDDIVFFAGSAIGAGIALTFVVIVADKVLGRESMGGGDVKLLAVAGLYFGWRQWLLLLILSCVIGIIVALVSQRRAGGDEDNSSKTPIPFGPSIAAACVIVMFSGSFVLNWYARLMM